MPTINGNPHVRRTTMDSALSRTLSMRLAVSSRHQVENCLENISAVEKELGGRVCRLQQIFWQHSPYKPDGSENTRHRTITSDLGRGNFAKDCDRAGTRCR